MIVYSASYSQEEKINVSQEIKLEEDDIMNEQEYMKILYIIHDYYEGDPIIIQWSNGLKVNCKSFTGIYETGTEPEDDDYIGEYAAAVSDVEILEQGKDDSIPIYNNCIEISLKCIPQKITLEDGTVLWEKEK